MALFLHPRDFCTSEPLAKFRIRHSRGTFSPWPANFLGNHGRSVILPSLQRHHGRGEPWHQDGHCTDPGITFKPTCSRGSRKGSDCRARDIGTSRRFSSSCVSGAFSLCHSQALSRDCVTRLPASPERVARRRSREPGAVRRSSLPSCGFRPLRTERARGPGATEFPRRRERLKRTCAPVPGHDGRPVGSLCLERQHRDRQARDADDGGESGIRTHDTVARILI